MERLVNVIDKDEQKKVREEIRKRWEAIGLTEGLRGELNEDIVKLFESEAKKVVADYENEPDEVNFPIIKQVWKKLNDE